MNAETMATKRASERRSEQLVVRLTDAEQKRLDEVAKLFPAHAKSVVIRAALMAGLEAIARDGITIAPAKSRR